MYPETKFNLPPYFNATFFMIWPAYAGAATDDEASCWAEWSACLSISGLITGPGKLFVTFVKGLLQTSLPTARPCSPAARVNMQESRFFSPPHPTHTLITYLPERKPLL